MEDKSGYGKHIRGNVMSHKKFKQWGEREGYSAVFDEPLLIQSEYKGTGCHDIILWDRYATCKGQNTVYLYFL